MKWMRCARTDKGVSAVGQVVSLKLILLPNVVEKINAQLPPAIQVLGYTRVTNSFDARIQCDKRRCPSPFHEGKTGCPTIQLVDKVV